MCALSAHKMTSSDPYLERLKRELDRPGRSQSQLARALKVAPSAINRLVNGKRGLKAEERDRIEEYLRETAAPAWPGPEGKAIEHPTGLTESDLGGADSLITMVRGLDWALLMALSARLGPTAQMVDPNINVQADFSTIPLTGKAITAHAFGLITDDELEDIKTVARVRAEAAHGRPSFITDDHTPDDIAGFLERHGRQIQSGQDPILRQLRFLAACAELAESLITRTDEDAASAPT